MSQELNITVAVRCRGRSQREIELKSPVVVTVPEGSATDVVINTSGDVGVAAQLSARTYRVDRVLGPSATQAGLYRDVAEPLFRDFVHGYNCTMLVYGMTATGKTYTMTGDTKLHGQEQTQLGDEAGVIPRVLFGLFETLAAQGLDYIVKCSFVELYNEELRDLLDEAGPGEAKKLRIFDSSPASSPRTAVSRATGARKYNYKLRRGGNVSSTGSTSTGATTTGATPSAPAPDDTSTIYIQNLQEFHVASARDGLTLLQRGLRHRQVATTKMNDFSSRSHTIFTITLYKQHEGELFRLSKMNLVDLAGSENINRSGAQNQRAKEAGSINQSLLTLGRVINSLADKNAHIPFRESKLTRLLQDSLGGNTKTALIATISPARATAEETCSTLEYASKAKDIRNKPQLGAFIMKDILLKTVTTELARLKNDLLATKAKDGVYMSQEHYKEMTHDMENYKTELDEYRRLVDTLNEKVATLTQDNQDLDKRIETHVAKEQVLGASVTELQQRLSAAKTTEDQLTSQVSQLNETASQLQKEMVTFKDREEIITTKFEGLLNDKLHILREKVMTYLNSMKSIEGDNAGSLDVSPHIEALQRNITTSLHSVEADLRESYKTCIEEFLNDTPQLFKGISVNVEQINNLSMEYYKQISENLSDISEEFNNLKQYLKNGIFENNHKELLGTYIKKSAQLMDNSSAELMENMKNMVEGYLQSSKQLLMESMQKSTSDIIEQEMSLLAPRVKKWESSLDMINKSDSLSNVYFNNMNQAIASTNDKVATSNNKINESIVKINETFSDTSKQRMQDKLSHNESINSNIKQILDGTDSLKMMYSQAREVTKESASELQQIDGSIRTILNSMNGKDNETVVDVAEKSEESTVNVTTVEVKGPLKRIPSNLTNSEVQRSEHGIKRRRLSRDESVELEVPNASR
ncbi:kinesin motor protein [Maudiozyma humilis]|uniref:Kinesin-like protein n=1 Tax=Maudiozyma humilis TaxID=51915 RepID=A0AAV5RXX8_MAUHU|nr:kinesin motor protein [Kazachstania humilis]